MNISNQESEAAGLGVRASRRQSGKRKRMRRSLAGLCFVAPAIILVLAFFLIPLGMAAWMSLHRWPLMGEPRFIGIGNYVRMWGDTRFWHALGFTVWYTIVVTISIFAVAFPLSLFVQHPSRTNSFYRTAIFLPVVVGFGSAALLWVWLMHVDTGLFSPAAVALDLIDEPYNLLASYNGVFWSIIIMVIWKTAGLTMVILMIGLQGVPGDILEAARIDGASRTQRFRRITLPLMRRTIALALTLSVAGSMLAFDQFYLISAGGPRNSTLTAVYWIFSQSFVSFRLGYGSALSMVLLLILVLITTVQLRLLRDPREAK